MNRSWPRQLVVLVIGILFGVLLVKGRAASWYRIQEMFWFGSFQLFGIIGSAILVAGLGILLIRRWQVRTLQGQTIAIADKPQDRGQWIGGALFGTGWALAGVCPGPMYALLGAEGTPALVVLTSALFGAWSYGVLKPRLPH